MMIYNEKTGKGNRIPFLDNMRMVMISLVVFVHAGFVYDYSLASVWIVSDPSKNTLFFDIFMIIDIFMIPILFLISGYFAPLSLEKTKAWDFLKSKFKRLMIPWLIAIITLIPIYKVVYLYSRGLPQESFINYFHFTNTILMNQGWLWFLPVLFLFNVVFLILSKCGLLNFKFSLKSVIIVIFLLGVSYSTCMFIFGLQDWTKTVLLDFQNERLFIYFLIFILGAVCYKKRIFETKPKNKKLYFILLFTVLIPILLYKVFQLNFYIYRGTTYIISKIFDGFIVAVGFNLSLLVLLYVVVTSFRYFFNRGGRLIQTLNKNSYGVYIIHFIITGGLALILLQVSIHSIIKWVVLSISTFVVSNIIISSYKIIKQRFIKNS